MRVPSLAVRTCAALASLRPGGHVREATGYDKRYVARPRESPLTSGRLKTLCVLSRGLRRGGGGSIFEQIRALARTTDVYGFGVLSSKACSKGA